MGGTVAISKADWEEPVLATDRLAAQLALEPIVVNRQAAVVEIAAERFALVASVVDCLGDRR
jgi:hypothetical protein